MLSNRQVCILKYLYPDKRINENELFNVSVDWIAKQEQKVKTK